MQIVNIDNKEKLNNFVGGMKNSQFLQSWQWGEFHKKVSGDVWRFGVEDNGELIAAMTIIKKQLPIGKSYFYCPRGPIINDNLEKSNLKSILDLLFDEVRNIAKNEGAMFLRFDPVFDLSDLNFNMEQTIDVQPKKTLVLDLGKSEEELLAAMHQKTRYNIKLAEKKGIKISEFGVERLEDFWRLIGETTERDDFRSHGKYYYEDMLKLGSDFIKLMIAEVDGKVLAASIVSFFGDSVVYMHGGSSNEDRNLMAPYLLQWESIKKAKTLGFKYYDFYGIDEERWPGVTRFKKGFSDEEINYPGTFDLIFDSGWYNIYKMLRRVRRTA